MEISIALKFDFNFQEIPDANTVSSLEEELRDALAEMAYEATKDRQLLKFIGSGVLRESQMRHGFPEEN